MASQVTLITGTKRPPARFGWIAVAIFAIAFGIRLVHVLQIRSAPFFALLMGDSRGYDEWASRLAAGDWIGHGVFYQAPLYPYFLGVVYRLAGRDLLLVRILQAMIGSTSCVLLAYAVRRLFSDRAGAIAGLMLAVWAPAIFFDGLLQKSVLDVFFICVLLWLLALATAEHAEHAGKHHSPQFHPPTWLSVGLALGALALTRENALVLIVVVLGWTVLQRHRARTAGWLLAGLAIVLAPVVIRNSLVGGGFYITTSQFGPNLYIGNNPQADGTYASLRYGRGAPEYERQDATELAERAAGRTLSPAEVSSYWTDRALAFIVSEPSAWLRLTARKFMLLSNRTEAVDTESQETHAEWSWPLRTLGPITHFGVLVPVALFGVLSMWPLRPPLGLLLALTIAYAASVVAFYVFARYRYPLVPFLMMFAAGGAASLIRRRSDVTAAIGWPITAVAFAAIVANWPLLSPALMQAVSENNLGVALQDGRQYDAAIAHYRKAIELRPEYPPAYNNLATALRAAGRADEAIQAYGRALELQPDFPDAQYNLANALVDRGRAEEAIGHYEIALRSLPASVEVHTNLGIALAGKGRTEEALAEFRAAIATDPQSARAHRNLGDLLASRGQTAPAIEHLRRSTEIDPTDAAAHYDLGSTLLEAGQLPDAIAAFREAIRLQPAFAEAHNNLGIALGSHGKLDEAIAEFQQALQIDPNLADARRNLNTALTASRRR